VQSTVRFSVAFDFGKRYDSRCQSASAVAHGSQQVRTVVRQSSRAVPERFLLPAALVGMLSTNWRLVMDKLSGILTGVAGEYFVAAELSRRGYIASITLRNSKGIDILASNATATRQVGIQVKTNQLKRPSWILNEKAETYYADNLFYVLVNLKHADERPEYYIVPSQVVAEHITQGHQHWRDSLGKQGQSHKDTSIRNYRDHTRKYLEQWEILGL
jgi:hypothetical protein